MKEANMDGTQQGTPRYATILRARGQKVRGILLGDLFELPMHYSADDGGVPCHGRQCTYCPKRRFFRWYGPAVTVVEKLVYPTAAEDAEYQRRRRLGENPKPLVAGPVLLPGKPVIAEWPDHALEALGDRGECHGDMGRRAIDGLAGLIYALSSEAGLQVRIVGVLQGQLPDPFPVEAILERIFGLPLFPPEESPQEKPDTIPFRREATG